MEPWAVHPFVGLGTVQHTAEELFLIENILGHCVSGAIPHCQAQSYLEKVNPNRDFVFALACMSMVHRNEMSKTGSLRMSLAQLFVNVCQPLCCAWLLNNQYHRATVCQEHLQLMACRTTSNEALHVGLKVAFWQTTSYIRRS